MPKFKPGSQLDNHATVFVQKPNPAVQTIRLRVDSQQDMDLLLDTYNLPINTSLAHTMRVLFVTLMHSYSHAEVRFPFSFCKPSYQKIPKLFLNNLRASHSLDEYQMDISKQGDTLLIRCGIKLIPHSFLKQVKEGLKNCSYYDIAKSQVPKSYQEQYHMMICRLRNSGVDVRLLRMGATWRFISKSPKTKPKHK